MEKAFTFPFFHSSVLLHSALFIYLSPIKPVRYNTAQHSTALSEATLTEWKTVVDAKRNPRKSKKERERETHAILYALKTAHNQTEMNREKCKIGYKVFWLQSDEFSYVSHTYTFVRPVWCWLYSFTLLLSSWRWRRHHCCQITTLPIKYAMCHLAAFSNRLKHHHFYTRVRFCPLVCIIYFVLKMTREQRVHYSNVRSIPWCDSGMVLVLVVQQTYKKWHFATVFHLMQNSKSNAMHK